MCRIYMELSYVHLDYYPLPSTSSSSSSSFIQIRAWTPRLIFPPKNRAIIIVSSWQRQLGIAAAAAGGGRRRLCSSSSSCSRAEEEEVLSLEQPGGKMVVELVGAFNKLTERMMRSSKSRDVVSTTSSQLLLFKSLKLSIPILQTLQYPPIQDDAIANPRSPLSRALSLALILADLQVLNRRFKTKDGKMLWMKKSSPFKRMIHGNLPNFLKGQRLLGSNRYTKQRRILEEKWRGTNKG